MLTTETTTPTTTARRPGDPRRLRRIAAAVILPLPALAIAVGRPLIPPVSALDTTDSLLDAIADRPVASHVAIWLGVVVLLGMVPAILAAVRLARRTRPVLATWAAVINLLAYLGAGLAFMPFDGVLWTAATAPGIDREGVVPLIDAFQSTGVMGLSSGLFVIGHVVGMVLLGLALWPVLPRWASVAITVSQPLHFVCFVILQNLWLDAAAWGLAVAGFAACSVAILRTPDHEWDVA